MILFCKLRIFAVKIGYMGLKLNVFNGSEIIDNRTIEIVTVKIRTVETRTIMIRTIEILQVRFKEISIVLISIVESRFFFLES